MGFDRTDVPAPAPDRAHAQARRRVPGYRPADLARCGVPDGQERLVAQQTIEPTLVAGFNQLFDDFNGTKADQAAGGLDFRATPDLTVGVEGIYRGISPPQIDRR